MQIMVKYGINLNQSEDNERAKNHRAYRIHSCFIFQMMDISGIRCRIK